MLYAVTMSSPYCVRDSRVKVSYLDIGLSFRGSQPFRLELGAVYILLCKLKVRRFEFRAKRKDGDLVKLTSMRKSKVWCCFFWRELVSAAALTNTRTFFSIAS